MNTTALQTAEKAEVLGGIPGTMTETSLALKKDLEFDDWSRVVGLLGQIGRSVQWWLGDALLYGEHAYGEKYVQAATDTGYEVQTLMDMVWVAKHVPAEQRRSGLPWSHHRVVASLDEEGQKELLDWAEENSTEDRKVSVKALREKSMELKSQRRREDNDPASRDVVKDNLFLVQSDVGSLDEHVGTESVDLILTAPSISDDNLFEVFEGLCDIAKHALKDGGSLMILIDHPALESAFRNLTDGELHHHWTLCFITDPAGRSSSKYKVKTSWKPLLWFTKGKYTGGQIRDIIDPSGIYHAGEGEESIEECLAQVVEATTLPGQTVLDPFCGGGHTAIAAVSKARYFIGADKSNSNLRKVENLVKKNAKSGLRRK
jgi:site-specific DNA-methyltransferase (adenine-specific)